VQWSSADDAFVATVAEFPSLSWIAPEQVEALRGVATLLTSVIADLETSGDDVPAPFAERTYSGRLNLRVSEDLHRRLATEALAQESTLNAYATELLERRASA
jgi:predicted HicB family RNase H-like nuclease